MHHDLEDKYWEIKSLKQMSEAEWESLCDGCGLCCLNKLEDEETGEVVYTRVVCRFSDIQTGQCTDYLNSSINVPSCVQLTPELATKFEWLPSTCAYRLLALEKKLPAWHHLVESHHQSNKRTHVNLASISVVVDDGILYYEDYLIEPLNN